MPAMVGSTATPITKMAEHLARARVQPASRAGRGLARVRGGNVASVETTGPTVDDAIDAALEKLDLDGDQVALEILDEGGDDQPARGRAPPRSEVSAQATVEAEVGGSGSEIAAEVEWDEGLATAG